MTQQPIFNIHQPSNTLEAKCPHCGGTGAERWERYDASGYTWGDGDTVDCEHCDGDGWLTATCDCGKELDGQGYCSDCEHYGYDIVIGLAA